MPRYYFHVFDGRDLPDDDQGTEMPSDAAAKDAARVVAGELIRNAEAFGIAMFGT